jgi:hypothetical protein
MEPGTWKTFDYFELDAVQFEHLSPREGDIPSRGILGVVKTTKVFQPYRHKEPRAKGTDVNLHSFSVVTSTGALHLH